MLVINANRHAAESCRHHRQEAPFRRMRIHDRRSHPPDDSHDLPQRREVDQRGDPPRHQRRMHFNLHVVAEFAERLAGRGQRVDLEPPFLGMGHVPRQKPQRHRNRRHVQHSRVHAAASS